MNTPLFRNVMLGKTKCKQVVDGLKECCSTNFNSLGPMPSIPPALVGLRDVSVVYTSKSVMEMSQSVNTGVGSLSMEGRT